MTESPTITNSRFEALEPLLAQLRQKYGPALQGVLVYGSCLRSGDFYEGLVDLYVIVDSYHACYGPGGLALGNWLLPPNVFYTQAENDGCTVRSKYAVVSAEDFARCNSTRRFESYFWGRFAQPTEIAYSRSESDREFLQQCLAGARATFLAQVLPALPVSGTLLQLWLQGLALSYGTELRTEREGRARELVMNAREFYEQQAVQLAGGTLPQLRVYEQSGALCYTAEVGKLQRKLAPLRWQLRKFCGKLFSVLRLIKALFTFDGGLDYIAWKLERHSGQRVEIPDKVRRRPLIHIWGLFWRLYRQGVFK